MLGDSFNLNGQTKVSDAEAREHELALFAKRFTQIPSNGQVRCDYGARTDGQPIYLGFAPRSLASSSTGWVISKFTYDGSNQMTLRQTAYDSWDNRATATYA